MFIGRISVMSFMRCQLSWRQTPLGPAPTVHLGEAVADPGERPAPAPPLIFRPNWGPKGWKIFLWDCPLPLISGSGNPPPPPAAAPFIWRSGSATERCPSYGDSRWRDTSKYLSWTHSQCWDGTGIFQSGSSEPHIRSNWGPQAFWVGPEIFVTLP